MALTCVTGGRECDGCQRCIPEPEAVDICAECKEPVFGWEDRYNIEGEIIHDDCLIDWAERFRVIPE